MWMLLNKTLANEIQRGIKCYYILTTVGLSKNINMIQWPVVCERMWLKEKNPLLLDGKARVGQIQYSNYFLYNIARILLFNII